MFSDSLGGTLGVEVVGISHWRCRLQISIRRIHVFKYFKLCARYDLPSIFRLFDTTLIITVSLRYSGAMLTWPAFVGDNEFSLFFVTLMNARRPRRSDVTRHSSIIHIESHTVILRIIGEIHA